MTEGRWTKVGVVAAVVSALVAVGVVVAQITGGDSLEPIAPITTSVGPGQSATGQAATPGPGDCVDADASAAGCGEAGSRFVVAAEPCTLEEARALLGVPAALQLHLQVATVDGGCAVGPNPTAARHGVTGETIHGLSSQEAPPAALVECVADDGTLLTCADPHRIEPVNSWTPAEGSAVEACAEQVRAYVNRSGAAGDPLTPEVQRGAADGRDVTRCVVRSSVLLAGTVYGIGGGRLPTAQE